MLLFGFLTLVLSLPLNQCKLNSRLKINVLLPRNEQYYGYDSNKLLSNNLPRKILDNFAKKFKLNIKYVTTNQTLSEIFENEDHRRNTLQS